MSLTTTTKTPSRGRRWASLLAPVAAVAIAMTGLGVAQATSQESPGHGEMEYGKTIGYYRGHTVDFSYSKGFFCDTSIPAKSMTGCEVGAKWKRAPSKQHDPLFITVPLGFTVPHTHTDCPDHLKCVDHPATMDLTRLATALAPIFKTTPAALEPALRDYMTPGHDHFITDLNHNKPEWWDVYVVGVTDRATYDKIHFSKDYRYIQKLIKAKNKHVVGPIPTNLFLYFNSK